LNTLQRYIFGRIALFTAGSFLAVVAVVWVTQVLTRVDFTTITGQSLASFLLAIVLMTPQLLALLLPISVVIGLVQVFTTMNSDSEMAVMSAAGVSRGMIAKPVLIIGLIAGALCHCLESFHRTPVRPLAARRAGDDPDRYPRQFPSGRRVHAARKRSDDLCRQAPSRQRSRRHHGLGYARRKDLADLLRAIGTRSVKVEGNDVLVMTNGQVQNKRVDDGAISVIRFNSYAISLAEFGSAGSSNFYYPQERETVDLFYPDPDDRVAKNCLPGCAAKSTDA
jgi:lipopolysaccharide export system permease protein